MAENNPSVARVVLNVTRGARKFVNVFHIIRDDGTELDPVDLVSMANTVATWWANTYRQTQNTDIVGSSVVATKLDPSDPAQETVLINQPGTNAGYLPADATLTMSWRTGLAGRRYRGRNYVFSLPDSVVQETDTITGGFVTTLTTVAQTLLNNLVAAGLELVIFHRDTNLYTRVAAVVIENILDSQRRRLPGRGQ